MLLAKSACKKYNWPSFVKRHSEVQVQSIHNKKSMCSRVAVEKGTNHLLLAVLIHGYWHSWLLALIVFLKITCCFLTHFRLFFKYFTRLQSPYGGPLLSLMRKSKKFDFLLKSFKSTHTQQGFSADLKIYNPMKTVGESVNACWTLWPLLNIFPVLVMHCGLYVCLLASPSFNFQPSFNGLDVTHIVLLTTSMY